MKTSVFLLLVSNLAYIGLLPIFFFRRDGRLNVRWWLTAVPFFLSGLVVVLHYLGWLQPGLDASSSETLQAISSLLSAASIGLISYTLGTHRRPLALWHQDNDVPEELVTYGAYRYIRHPFYSSFIVALFAVMLSCPAWWTATIVVYGAVALSYTAWCEERRLCKSSFGPQYRAYLRHSGRFFPKPRRVVP